MRRGRKARGFTLVELLVVISIIGMLMALLLPAIGAARERARQNTCANNMRNVGFAMLQYEGNKKSFPGYANPIKDPTTGTAIRAGSFIVPVLPYLERNDLYDSWSTTPAAAATPFMEILTCPSDPLEATVGDTPPMAFCVNAGRADGTQTTAQQAAGGLCFDQTIAAPVRVGLDYVSSRDGSSTTILASENVQTYSWNLKGADVAAQAAAGQAQTTFFWWSTTSAQPANIGTTRNIINADKVNTAAPIVEPVAHTAATSHARPSSYHVNGVNVYFCDNHVRFISDSVDHDVYKHLMTPYGKVSDSGNGTAVLDESSF